MKVYHGAPKEGFYIYANGGSGESNAVRLEYVELPESSFCCWISCEQAISIADTLYKVVEDYNNGIQTENIYD